MMKEWLAGFILIWALIATFFTQQAGHAAHKLWNDLQAGWETVETREQKSTVGSIACNDQGGVTVSNIDMTRVRVKPGKSVLNLDDFDCGIR